MVDLLHSTHMGDCKPVATPLTTKQAIVAHGDELYSNVSEYR